MHPVFILLAMEAAKTKGGRRFLYGLLILCGIAAVLVLLFALGDNLRKRFEDKERAKATQEIFINQCHACMAEKQDKAKEAHYRYLYETCSTKLKELTK